MHGKGLTHTGEGELVEIGDLSLLMRSASIIRQAVTTKSLCSRSPPLVLSCKMPSAFMDVETCTGDQGQLRSVVSGLKPIGPTAHASPPIS